MEFENTVTYLLAKLSLAHRNLFEKAAVGAGLHSGQAFVLMELWKEDGQRQIDLASKLNLSAPTVNKILGGLLETTWSRAEGMRTTPARRGSFLPGRASKSVATLKNNGPRLKRGRWAA